MRQQFLASIHLYYFLFHFKEQVFQWKTLTKALVYLHVELNSFENIPNFFEVVINGNTSSLNYMTLSLVGYLDVKSNLTSSLIIAVSEKKRSYWCGIPTSITEIEKIMIVPSQPSQRRRPSWVLVLSKVLVQINFCR